MSQSRYREARTLVRRLCRLPGEEKVEFKRKVFRLRDHFARFNLDVSELCQWIMGLRRTYATPDNPTGFGVLGDFLLEPVIEGLEADESEHDRWRLHVFDDVAGFRPCRSIANRPLPQSLRGAMDHVAVTRPDHNSKNANAYRLFDRLRTLEPQHRLVLLKSAAEWVVARYQRGVEDWVRQHTEWKSEKEEWERQHPALTEDIRDQFTRVFKELIDPERDGQQGIWRKNPRICSYDRMGGNTENCVYAGQKGHGPLCWKYVEFVRDRKLKNPNFNDKKFAADAEGYLPRRARGKQRHLIMREMFPNNPQGQQRFCDNWTAYLNAMGIREQTVAQHGRLPHCLKIGETFEKSRCTWNPHTDLCKLYKRALDQFNKATLKLEPEYREWRRLYLAGRPKPSFRYPSGRDLPMPKVFGAGFYEIDFDSSVVRLRLDDMSSGEWIEFGFIPWPRNYHPSRKKIKEKVTSVHVNFVGTHARAGFRFDVPQKQSRFACTQDEIDELRSRKFPRRAQDHKFLESARTRLLEGFSGNADSELRLLAVDLGETGAAAAVYAGRAFENVVPLEIVKINKRYASLPSELEPDRHGRPEKRYLDKNDSRGLRKEHVARHLESLAQGAARVAQHRQAGARASATLEDHDFRALKRHVAWMIRDWVRHNAAQIVAAAEDHECDLIVFESLRGFKPPGFDQLGMDSERKKRWLAMFAYGRIRRKVVEKAVERGMRVVTVPYFKSSQFCAACGHEQQNKDRWRKYKRERKFNCDCGERQTGREKQACAAGGDAADTRPNCRCIASFGSDDNAARVLARVFWGEITLPLPEEKPSQKG